MKPRDRIPIWPEQAACMRAQRCMDFLREILPDAQYMAVRTTVCQWDTRESEAEDNAEAARRCWEKRRAG